LSDRRKILSADLVRVAKAYAKNCMEKVTGRKFALSEYRDGAGMGENQRVEISAGR